MKSIKFALSGLVIFAIALALIAIFYPTPTYEELLEEQQRLEGSTTMSVTIEPAGEDVVAYAPSLELFVIEVPETWNVSQSDAGGLSLIRFDNEGLETGFEIYLGQSSTLEGDPVVLETWTNERLLEADELSQCELAVLGNLSVDCFVALIDGERQRMYFGELDTLRHIQVVLPEEHEEFDAMQDIIGTIMIHPSDEMLKNVTIIQ